MGFKRKHLFIAVLEQRTDLPQVVELALAYGGPHNLPV